MPRCERCGEHQAELFGWPYGNPMMELCFACADDSEFDRYEEEATGGVPEAGAMDADQETTNPESTKDTQG